jgi:hypothetical protein
MKTLPKDLPEKIYGLHEKFICLDPIVYKSMSLKAHNFMWNLQCFIFFKCTNSENLLAHISFACIAPTSRVLMATILAFLMADDQLPFSGNLEF